MSTSTKWAAFNWKDPFGLEGQLTEEERQIRDTTHGYAQAKLAPRVRHAYRDESTDPLSSGRWVNWVCSAAP